MAQPLICRFPSWHRVFAIITCLVLSGSVLLPTARAQEDLTVNVRLTSATLDQLGALTVTGTLTCSEPVGDAWVEAYVVQPVGRLQAVYGYGFDQLDGCDVTPLPFEFVVLPETGKLTPGTAYVTLYAGACIDPSDFFGECGFDAVTKAFKLKRAK
jgi:hypothetical protein